MIAGEPMNQPDETQATNCESYFSRIRKRLRRRERTRFLHAALVALLCVALATQLRADTISGTVKDPSGAVDVTGGFCTSGSERESTLEGSWHADEEIQAGADCDVVAAG